MHLIALVPLVGDHAAAAVLWQIMEWHRGDQRWIAKSRAEMCKETGITLDQYKRIMPLLVREGWIVMERHLFKNKVTPFISLTIKSSRLVANATNPLVSNDTKLIDHINTTDRSTSIYSIESKESTDRVLAVSCSRTTSTNDPSTGRRLGEEEEEGRKRKEEENKVHQGGVESSKAHHEKPTGKFMKAADVLKAMHAPSHGSLGAFWKARCALVTEEWQRALTNKELAQLKQLHKYLGDQTKPVIDYAINHWVKFAQEAGASAGTSFPVDPHIGFLLKHHAVAVNLLMHQAAKSLPPTPEEAPVQPIAPAHDEEQPVHTITSQELTELLEGLKSP